MLNYPPLHYSSTELSALAARAQAGDHEAFTLLIRGTIAIYWSTAQSVASNSNYHKDMIQDAILHTWRCVLPAYDPSLSWAPLAKKSIRTRMALYCRMAAGPLTNTQTRVPPHYAAPLPASAQGIVDPDRCRTPIVTHSPSVVDELVKHERLSRLQAELDRLQPIERDSVLELGRVCGERYGFTQKRANQIYQSTKALLRKRLHDIHP